MGESRGHADTEEISGSGDEVMDKKGKNAMDSEKEIRRSHGRRRTNKVIIQTDWLYWSHNENGKFKSLEVVGRKTRQEEAERT